MNTQRQRPPRVHQGGAVIEADAWFGPSTLPSTPAYDGQSVGDAVPPLR